MTTHERRILVLAPTKRDASLTKAVFHEGGIACCLCPNVEQLAAELQAGAAAVLLAEEAISAEQITPLLEVIALQPPWSDIPVLLVTAPGADSSAVALAIESLGNVTLVERPTRVTALIAAAKSMLRARERQYQARDYLLEREQAAERLQQADRRKDEFLATLAHELRNPLAPIRNSLQILRMAAGGSSSAERVCEMLERQVNHMVRLIDDLMEVSRITRGKIELRRKETDLASVLRSAVETTQPLVESGQHQLVVSLPAERILLDGDEVRLEQVFANLLNNAAKYTNPGGKIWLTAQRRDGEVVVSVRDNGIGLSAEALPAVFEMFVQADRSNQRSQGGLGIGLTLVKNLVELHGGTITAHSAGLGQGSEFIVRLPLPVEQAPTPAAPADDPTAPSVQRRVMVVDDHRDAAFSMGMLLKYLGMNVQIVNDGAAALSMMENFRPEIVFLDIGMPRMDGFEVARRIREQGEFSHVMLIALTGWGQAEDRNRTHAAGFDHHLVKPADLKMIQSLLGSAG